MRITEWKKHYSKIVHKYTDVYEEGKCYDLATKTVEKQLSQIKESGKHKIYYLKVEKSSLGNKDKLDEVNLKLICDDIYVGETQY